MSECRMRTIGRVSKVRHLNATQLRSGSAELEYSEVRATDAVVIRKS